MDDIASNNIEDMIKDVATAADNLASTVEKACREQAEFVEETMRKIENQDIEAIKNKMINQ